jgi:hypothetical protein
MQKEIKFNKDNLSFIMYCAKIFRIDCRFKFIYKEHIVKNMKSINHVRHGRTAQIREEKIFHQGKRGFYIVMECISS